VVKVSIENTIRQFENEKEHCTANSWNAILQNQNCRVVETHTNRKNIS